jgi:hypothetical protein
MYNVAKAKQYFWTVFGQYMAPVLSDNGNKINWLNYKTGIKHIYFKMDAGKDFASIGIELRHPDPVLQQQYFERFLKLQNIFEDVLQEQWLWQSHITDRHSNLYSKISKKINGVNIFDNHDWPAIISFLKPRLIGLDKFWNPVKDSLE